MNRYYLLMDYTVPVFTDYGDGNVGITGPLQGMCKDPELLPGPEGIAKANESFTGRILTYLARRPGVYSMSSRVSDYMLPTTTSMLGI